MTSCGFGARARASQRCGRAHRSGRTRAASFAGVHSNANCDHRIYPFDFGRASGRFEAFARTKRSVGPTLFCESHTSPRCSNFPCKSRKADRETTPARHDSGRRRPHGACSGERHDRRCQLAFSLTHRARVRQRARNHEVESGIGPKQSGLTPASFTTLAHLAISAF